MNIGKRPPPSRSQFTIEIKKLTKINIYLGQICIAQLFIQFGEFKLHKLFGEENQKCENDIHKNIVKVLKYI